MLLGVVLVDDTPWVLFTIEYIINVLVLESVIFWLHLRGFNPSAHSFLSFGLLALLNPLPSLVDLVLNGFQPHLLYSLLLFYPPLLD